MKRGRTGRIEKTTYGAEQVPRNRVFAYDAYLSILNEGTEPR